MHTVYLNKNNQKLFVTVVLKNIFVNLFNIYKNKFLDDIFLK